MTLCYSQKMSNWHPVTQSSHILCLVTQFGHILSGAMTQTGDILWGQFPIYPPSSPRASRHRLVNALLFCCLIPDGNELGFYCLAPWWILSKLCLGSYHQYWPLFLCLCELCWYILQLKDCCCWLLFLVKPCRLPSQLAPSLLGGGVLLAYVHMHHITTIQNAILILYCTFTSKTYMSLGQSE